MVISTNFNFMLYIYPQMVHNLKKPAGWIPVTQRDWHAVQHK